jgi:hypothetical protein
VFRSLTKGYSEHDDRGYPDVTFALLSVLGVFAAGLVPVASTPTCADTLLTDWYDGALDGTYEPQCYRDALDALPEDVRVYTTAVDDISRALRQRLAHDGGDAAAAGDGSSRSLSGVRRAQNATKAAKPAAGGATRLAVDETATARRPPLPLLLLVTLALVLAVSMSGTMLARRVRRKP